MRNAINFNDKPKLSAHKICYVTHDWPLPFKLKSIQFSPLKYKFPYASFSFGHIRS